MVLGKKGPRKALDLTEWRPGKAEIELKSK